LNPKEKQEREKERSKVFAVVENEGEEKGEGGVEEGGGVAVRSTDAGKQAQGGAFQEKEGITSVNAKEDLPADIVKKLRAAVRRKQSNLCEKMVADLANWCGRQFAREAVTVPLAAEQKRQKRKRSG